MPTPKFQCKCAEMCIAYYKTCPICNEANPRFEATGETQEGKAKEKTKSDESSSSDDSDEDGPDHSRPIVKLDEIPTWPAMWNEKLKQFQDKLLIERPPGIRGEYKVDSTVNERIRFYHGDITHLDVDAIVNAANSGLFAGGGVCGAIHAAAGPQLEAECRRIGGCKTGSAVMTKGYRLHARHVIHAVGPIGRNDDQLVSAYRTCLDIAHENSLESIAFCCISTGVFGFPNRPAAYLALRTVREWLLAHPDSSVKAVVFCTFMNEDRVIYYRFAPIILPVEPAHVQPEKDLPAAPTIRLLDVGTPIFVPATRRRGIIVDIQDNEYIVETVFAADGDIAHEVQRFPVESPDFVPMGGQRPREQADLWEFKPFGG